MELGLSAIQSVVEVWYLGASVSGDEVARFGGPDARLDDHSRPSACGRRDSKKGDEALGRSRGGFSTKLHFACDSQGQAVELRLGPGQESDIGRAAELLGDHQPRAVIADKGYDADAFLELVSARDAQAVIPPTKNRTVQRRSNKRKYQ